MLQELAYVAIIVFTMILAIPFGMYLAKVFNGEPTLLSPVLRPIERWLYKVCGIDENREMTWKKYVATLIGFEILSVIFAFVIMRLQGVLPLNPQGLGAISWDLALNQAISWTTNTQWISYTGERDLSYMTQLLGLLVQDYISPTIGFVCVVTLARSFSRRHSPTVGNFWVDMTRAILYVWIPLTILVFPLISQGVVMNFDSYMVAHTLEGGVQLIPGGPAATTILYQLICEDGGNFFGQSMAHPFENPTPFNNWLSIGYILFVPVSIVVMIGRLAKSRDTTIALFSVMSLLFLLGMPLPFYAENQPNPTLENLGVAGGINLEGKEVRFSMFEHILYIIVGMAPANGSTITQHDSLAPLSILQVIFFIVIGAPIYGCIGEGSLAMLHYFIVSMFVAGLMTGRTPEIIGKKLELREIILAGTSFLFSSFSSLVTTAVAIISVAGLATLGNAGPHGLTEVLFAFTSCSINNGSYMGGLNVLATFINLMTPPCMILGRYSTMLVALAIAGSMARKGQIAVSAATLPVASPLFIITVVFVVFILSALAFFPVATIGPILEHMMMLAGKTF
ncbi:MAG: potassium-transporting ATPase subunit KdpA [Methanotrichaceae archaeon]